MWASSLWLLLNLWVLKTGPIFKFTLTKLQFLLLLLCFLCDGNAVLFHTCLMAWSTLGFWYHLGWRGDGQDLLGWVVVFIPVRQEPGSGPQAHWRLHSGGSCCLKPTLSGSSPTFTTFWSHKWWFWERLRWDPFQKEVGRRAIEPNGTQENHFMRLK